jgi:hypothetical protein
MTSSESNYIETLNNINIDLHRYVIPIFYVLGNVGNVLSALVFSKKSWRKKVCVFYLNVCLFFNSCYINSSMLGYIFTIGFNINLQNSSTVLCKLYFYLSFLFSTLLPTVLILASVDRLLISSQNVDTRLYSSRRLGYFSISISTFIWCVFYSHLLIKVNIQEIYSTIFVCNYDSSKYYLYFVSYSTITITALSCLIMIVLSVLTFKNVRAIRSIPHQQRHQIRSMAKKDFQLLRCLFVQDIIFATFSISLTVSNAYSVAAVYQTQTALNLEIVNFFSNFSLFLHHIPFGASFFIFIGISKAFRSEMKRMIYKICGRNRMVILE